MTPDSTIASASSGTIIVGKPPKPKFEFFLSVIIFAASALLIASKLNFFNDYRIVEKEPQKR